MNCSTCDSDIDGAAIFGMVRPDGVWMFGWTCCHWPVGDVAVILGSQACADAWMAEHPEHARAVAELIEAREHSHA